MLHNSYGHDFISRDAFAWFISNSKFLGFDSFSPIFTPFFQYGWTIVITWNLATIMLLAEMHLSTLLAFAQMDGLENHVRTFALHKERLQ